MIIFIDGQKLTSSLITSAQNSFSLSDCKLVEEELIKKNKSNKKATTSTVCLEVSDFVQENWVKWSQTWQMYL